MELLLEALTYHRGSDEPTSVMVILALRVTLVLATGWLAARALARASAAVQHRVWLLTVLGTLVVPLVWALTPSWRVPLVAVHVAGARWQGHFAAPVSAPAPLWPQVLLAVWIAGAVVGLGYAMLGIVYARFLFQRSRPCTDPGWLALLDQARQQVGLRRQVELRITRRSMSPAVWSLARAQVLLPEQSLSWPSTQRRSVLLHELAHVARRDCASQLLAAAACAVWWFHPLAWHAARRLRALGELAADDCVIRAGGNRADYAGALLSIAGALGFARVPAVAQTMFHPSHLEQRLRAILDPARQRSPLGGRGSAASIVAGLALMIPLATFTPSVIRAVGSPQPAAAPTSTRTLDVDVHLKLRVTVPTRAVETRSGEHPPIAVAPAVVPPVPQPPPAVKFELIPNWETGRHAEMLIPNYVPGMAQVVPVAPPQAATGAPPTADAAVTAAHTLPVARPPTAPNSGQ